MSVHSQNWIKHWVDKATPPAGAGKQPVTWVSYNDAATYCAANGKRLPHSPEWQLAAQGTDGRRWPWGDVFDKAKVPPISIKRDYPPLMDVDSHSGTNARSLLQLLISGTCLTEA